MLKKSVFLISLVGVLSLTPVFSQTSGATAPEVTQFEPVDTTDMVNLSTGDFSYSIPVVSIPGAPGGSYPISLNYHAGVLYTQEASWVGLGWNLSPGQIARTVRGFPDDWKDAPILKKERIPDVTVYTYSVGFVYGPASVGLNWDNHGGFGGTIGLEIPKTLGIPEGPQGLGSIELSFGYGDVGLRLGGQIAKNIGYGISLSAKRGGWSRSYHRIRAE